MAVTIDRAIPGQGQWPPFFCPTHQKTMQQDGDTLACPGGGECVSIVDGIPRFAPQSSYADGFGAQWNTYRTTQLDSHTGVPISAERARRCLGEELWHGLEGLSVLECGCGAGRFTEVLLARGARVTSIDLSNAVDANQENFPQGPTHRVVQTDILNLPFAPHQYDLVFCLGVIQHTPVPEISMIRLLDQVKPGGSLVIDHYTHKISMYTKLEPLYRSIVKRLSPEKSIAVTRKMVDVFLPLHKVGKISKWGQRAVSRVSPVRAHYHAFPELSDDTLREWAMVDTHDALARQFSWKRTRSQIRKVFENAGAVDVWCEYGGNGVEARVRLPD